MDLIDRKYRILQAIIDDYIMTALPVGSRTISRKYEQKLSSATIRNEMSDLEELGYLDSPHTSAGRIPSYKAYRLYVDRLIRPMPLSEEETAFIKGCFDHRINQVEELSARIAKALSSMTHYTTAVMTRAPREEQVFSHSQLVLVSDRPLLLVHGTFASQQEIESLAERFGDRLSWVLCPRSNDYIEGARPPVETLRRAGVRSALGTDSLSSNETLSIVEELKMLRSVPLDEALRWATLGGAEALGIDLWAGSFVPGKRPGAVLLGGIDFRTTTLRDDAFSRRIL